MSDKKMQELNQDLLEDDDDLLSDIPMSLLDTSPMTWEEEELPVEDIPEDTFEDDLLAEEFLSEDEFLEDDISIEELLADYPTEPELRKEEKLPTKKTSKKNEQSKQKSDRALIILMAVASFLCIGIIGMLIYWLEVFL